MPKALVWLTPFFNAIQRLLSSSKESYTEITTVNIKSQLTLNHRLVSGLDLIAFPCGLPQCVVGFNHNKTKSSSPPPPPPPL